MLETNEPATIVPTRIGGNVQFYLGFSPNSYESFYQQKTFEPIKLTRDQIQAEKNYYLIVEALTISTELSLTLQQSNTYTTLYDGVPQTIFFESMQDAYKTLLFNMP